MGKLNFPLNTPRLFSSRLREGEIPRRTRAAFCIPQDKCMNSWSGASHLTRILSTQPKLKTEFSYMI